MSFYDEVLREVIAAVGAALFVGNLVALLRRRRDQQTAASPKARPARGTADDEDLPEAPVARTVTYMVLGFVVMVWGIGSIIVG
jgi:hypothetical protein